MTVTTQKIKAEISSQTIGCAAGVVDVSEKIIAKGAAKLKQQGLKENYAISLMTQFFKVPDQNGRDSLIKMFSGTKCVTVNADYLTEHFSTDNRIIGKNISNCLVTVVGYSQFPSQGAYVREGGAIYFNTWRPPVEMFNEADFIQFYSDGYGKCLADIDLFLSSAGQAGGNIDLSDALKPTVWLALEKLWFPNKPEEAKIFTDWLSLVITAPSYRTRWTPLIRSVYGIGKGTLVQSVIRPLLGAHTVKELDYKRTVGTFSGELFLNRLVVMNEVEATKPEQYNNLKSIISDDYHFVERKGEQAFDAKMYFATLMFSNKEKPLPIPKGDRRYWLPDYIHYPSFWGDTDDDQKRNAARFFRSWRYALEEGGLKELAMFLRWNAFNRAEVHDTAPMSEGKTEIISCRTEDASDKLVIYLQDSVHEGEGLKVGDLQSLFSPALSDADVKRVLTAQGFEAGRHSIAKGQMRCWTFNGTPATRLHIPTVRR